MINTIFTLDHNVGKGVSNIRTDNLNFQVGFVFDKLVKIFCNTGCTIVVVNKKLVPQAAFTGRKEELSWLTVPLEKHK